MDDGILRVETFTPEEFRIALAVLNMNYTSMARALHVRKETTGRWGRGEHPIPYTAQIVIRQMLAERGGVHAEREFAK